VAPFTIVAGLFRVPMVWGNFN